MHTSKALFSFLTFAGGVDIVNFLYYDKRGFLGGSAVKNPPASARDVGSTRDQEDSAGQGETKSRCHNYGAHGLDPMSRNY